MIISVAMTTYNGAKYIERQLDSIRFQSRLVDEVIICDDISDDGTSEIVMNYILLYGLDNWKFEINHERLGWKQNFRKAISKTTGDIVFFSDQDDIWLENKIEKMTELMIENDIGCLYGKSIKIDQDDYELKERNEQRRYSHLIKQIPLTHDFFNVGGLGCCMCVNRRVINKYMELNCVVDDHDSQCPRIAILYDTLYCLDEPVIRYRIHSENTSEISSEYTFGTSSLEKRIQNIREIVQWLSIVKNDKTIVNDPDKLKLVLGALNAERERLSYLRCKKKCIIRMLRYYRYYSGLSMFIGDFAYKNGINRSLGKLRWKLKKIYS